MSGRAIEAAGDVDARCFWIRQVPLHWETGQADAFIPVDGNDEKDLADAAQPSIPGR